MQQCSHLSYRSLDYAVSTKEQQLFSTLYQVENAHPCKKTHTNALHMLKMTHERLGHWDCVPLFNRGPIHIDNIACAVCSHGLCAGPTHRCCLKQPYAKEASHQRHLRHNWCIPLGFNMRPHPHFNNPKMILSSSETHLVYTTGM